MESLAKDESMFMFDGNAPMYWVYETWRENLKHISHQTTEKQSQIESTPRLYNLVLDKLLLVKPSDFHTA